MYIGNIFYGQAQGPEKVSKILSPQTHLPTLALHSQFYHIHLREAEFALESIDYNHIAIATPSQNSANTRTTQNGIRMN